ncbi:MAG: restriction endonuclease subunit S [Firmicutes bacterium]|nr:restriction endonuclease subunit S [Bacillota bacterium]
MSDVMELIGGGTPKTTTPEYWNGNIPWLSVKDFNNDARFVYKTEKSITSLGLKNSSTTLLQKGDMIISARGTVGEIASIPFPMAFNQSCYGLRAKKNIVTEDYLYYLVKQSVDILKKNTHGSVFDTITRTTFEGIEVEIPTLETQKKIAAILSALDEKIAINRAINENLQQQVYALFDSWFVSFDQTDGKMPADWREGTLGEITTITSGKRPPMKQPTATTEVSIPLVGAASIMGFTNAVLYNEPILVTGRVGTHGVVQRFQSPCWTSDNTLVIKSEFYEYAFQALQRVDYVNMNRGSTQPLITQTDLKNVSIVIPTEAILLEYEKIAGTLMAMYESNRKENERLAVLRDTLLPRLMNGEIDVSNIEI